MSILNKARGIIDEAVFRRERQIIESHPDQVIVDGAHSLMLFQPHHLAYYDRQLWQSCDDLIKRKVNQEIARGRSAVFFFEDASKDHKAMKRAINRTSRGADLTTDRAIQLANLESAQQGNGMAAYNFLLNSTVVALREKYNKPPMPPRIWSVTEMMPNIQACGNHVFSQLDPREVALETSMRRNIQVTAYMIARDIGLISQIVQELQRNPNLSIFMMRGTEHVGLAAGLKTLIELAYPQFEDIVGDIDNEKKTTSDEATAIVTRPIVWSRKLWQEIYRRKPYLLQLPQTYRQGVEMHDTVGMIKTLLQDEPWSSYMHRALIEISQTPYTNDLVHIHLTQHQFDV